MRCPGSNMVLDGPDDTTHLTCPNCAQRVPVTRYDVLIERWNQAPRWILRGHQLPNF